MSLRHEIQAQLDALAEMLDHWVTRVRHPAQFWPQFEVLAAEILDQCARTERDEVRACIDAMLKDHGLKRPSGHEGDDRGVE